MIKGLKSLLTENGAKTKKMVITKTTNITNNTNCSNTKWYKTQETGNW